MIFKSMYVKIGSTSNNVHNKVDKKWWGRDDIAKNKRTSLEQLEGGIGICTIVLEQLEKKNLEKKEYY